MKGERFEPDLPVVIDVIEMEEREDAGVVACASEVPAKVSTLKMLFKEA
jgi:hypothetical protein